MFVDLLEAIKTTHLSVIGLDGVNFAVKRQCIVLDSYVARIDCITTLIGLSYFMVFCNYIAIHLHLAINYFTQ